MEPEFRRGLLVEVVFHWLVKRRFRGRYPTREKVGGLKFILKGGTKLFESHRKM
jgi:hypothetical protein